MDLVLWRWSTVVQLTSLLMVAAFFLVLARTVASVRSALVGAGVAGKRGRARYHGVLLARAARPRLRLVTRRLHRIQAGVRAVAAPGRMGGRPARHRGVVAAHHHDRRRRLRVRRAGCSSRPSRSWAWCSIWRWACCCSAARWRSGAAMASDRVAVDRPLPARRTGPARGGRVLGGPEPDRRLCRRPSRSGRMAAGRRPRRSMPASSGSSRWAACSRCRSAPSASWRSPTSYLRLAQENLRRVGRSRSADRAGQPADACPACSTTRGRTAPRCCSSTSTASSRSTICMGMPSATRAWCGSPTPSANRSVRATPSCATAATSSWSSRRGWIGPRRWPVWSRSASGSTEEPEPRVGFSCGVAELAAGGSPDAALQAADRAMYEMKKRPDGTVAEMSAVATA